MTPHSIVKHAFGLRVAQPELDIKLIDVRGICQKVTADPAAYGFVNVRSCSRRASGSLTVATVTPTCQRRNWSSNSVGSREPTWRGR